MSDNESRLDAIRTRFLSRLSEQRDMLERMAGLRDASDEILDIAHKIAGIAGSLGFPLLSAAASEVEMMIVRSCPAMLRDEPPFERLMLQIGKTLDQS